MRNVMNERTIFEATNVLHAEISSFLSESMERSFILPIAKLLHVVPDCLDFSRASEHKYCSDFLQPSCENDGYVKGSREPIPVLGPECKYHVLCD
eukprot:9372639-Karenia_brevis.AAC.1